jgi:invasion protein IalB
MGKKKSKNQQQKGNAPATRLKEGDKDWDSNCQVCGQSPTVHPTDLCGPCCFGDSETIGGNW